MNNDNKRKKLCFFFVCLFDPLIDRAYKKISSSLFTRILYLSFFIHSDHVMMFNFLSYCGSMKERKDKNPFAIDSIHYHCYTYFHPVFSFSSIIRTKEKDFLTSFIHSLYYFIAFCVLFVYHMCCYHSLSQIGFLLFLSLLVFFF